jgi:RNA polymerase sigma-70 factor (ECF subfamily)
LSAADVVPGEPERPLSAEVLPLLLPLGPEADAAEASVVTAGGEVFEAGDEVPWRALIERYSRRVVVSLLARGIGLERARELADDAWMRIIGQHRAGRLPQMKIPGLVVMQALFLARDDRRLAMRRAAVDQRIGGDYGLHGSAEGVEQQLLAREQLRQIAKVVEAASPTARKVFELSFGEAARTPAEVAEELGLSLQRVRQICCELRKRIRVVVGEGSHE